MEVHLPYLAVRFGPEIHDSRKLRKGPLRKGQPMLPEFLPDDRKAKAVNDAQYDAFYYEAQISVLVVGVDEWLWTGYCFADTYFRTGSPPAQHVRHGMDALVGAGAMLSLPFWNPREYFLHVMSRRTNQMTKEWAQLIAVLSSRLESYVRRVSLRKSKNNIC